jgi:hypothetical protein
MQGNRFELPGTRPFVKVLEGLDVVWGSRSVSSPGGVSALVLKA